MSKSERSLRRRALFRLWQQAKQAGIPDTVQSLYRPVSFDMAADTFVFR